MVRFALIGVIAAVAVGLLVWKQQRSPEFYVSGVIEADDVRVGSRVGGRVAAIAVEEGQRVRKGDLLLTLAPYDLQAQRAQAEAIVAARREQSAKLQNGPRPEEIAAARAERERKAAVLARLKAGPRPLEIEVLVDRLAVARAERDNAQTQYDRVAGLSQAGAAGRQEYSDATQALAAALARFSLAEHELELAREGTRVEELAEAEAALKTVEANLQLLERGYRAEDIASADADVAAAESALDAIDRRLDELRVEAPIDGIIEALELQPGDLVAPNAPVLTLVNPERLYVRSYLPETRLDIQLDREVRLRVDAYPNRWFRGVITHISRSAEFTPANVQTVEERVKQVFRIKVEIREAAAELRPGMVADVFFDDTPAGAAASP